MDVQHAIWFVEIGAEAVLLAALLARKLAVRYVAFSTFVAFSIVSDVGLTFFGDPAHSRSYLVAWIAVSIVAMLLQIAVVLELFRRICEHYSGIGRFGRTLVLALVGVAVLCTLATVFPELRVFPWRRSILQTVVRLLRVSSTVLALFLVATAVFFAYFPTPLRRNIITHGRLLALYFVVNACSYMAVIIKGVAWSNIVSETLLSIAALCFLAWALLLTTSGETVPQPRRVSDQDSQRVERWNKDLLRAGRWLVN